VRAKVSTASTEPRDPFVARIEIPRLDLTAAVLEGVDAATLRTAVGHVPGTAMPGDSGRIALAAHRDTFFRGLRDIQPSDTVRLINRTGTYEFRVVGTEVVPPNKVEVIAPTRESRLTLITCYPFSYVGRAPLRFIVHADPVGVAQPTVSAQRVAPAEPPRKPASRPRRTHGEPSVAVERPAEAVEPEPVTDEDVDTEQQASEEQGESATRRTSGPRKVAGAMAAPFRKAFGWIR
jgi:LPXTG-site transpeptidase (sortase) family protein